MKTIKPSCRLGEMALGPPDIVTPAERASRAMQRWASASTVKQSEQPLRPHHSGGTAAGGQDNEARRLAEESARQRVAAARERKAAAEWRLATAQEAAAAEDRRLRQLERASIDVDTAHSRLMAARASSKSAAIHDKPEPEPQLMLKMELEPSPRPDPEQVQELNTTVFTDSSVRPLPRHACVRMCRFVAGGTQCFHGSRCSFAHSEEELASWRGAAPPYQDGNVASAITRHAHTSVLATSQELSARIDRTRHGIWKSDVGRRSIGTGASEASEWSVRQAMAQKNEHNRLAAAAGERGYQGPNKQPALSPRKSPRQLRQPYDSRTRTVSAALIAADAAESRHSAYSILGAEESFGEELARSSANRPRLPPVAIHGHVYGRKSPSQEDPPHTPVPVPSGSNSQPRARVSSPGSRNKEEGSMQRLLSAAQRPQKTSVAGSPAPTVMLALASRLPGCSHTQADASVPGTGAGTTFPPAPLFLQTDGSHSTIILSYANFLPRVVGMQGGRQQIWNPPS